MRYYDFKEKKQKAINELFEECEAFFAFSKKQLEEGKKENVKYFSLGGGMYIPQDNYDKFNAEFEKIEGDYIKEALKLFSSDEIIGYELANHEYCITYDITDTMSVLSDFNFTNEEYANAIKIYLKFNEEY